ncbi:Glycoside hydrolase, 38 vacuolar alpha mannosidase, partial [Dinochytrium kinnereticum]
TQFGVMKRPTHYNTSWDLAKFEVFGHKFVDLSEHGYGVALLSDSKYGYSVKGNIMRMTLLRSPKAPDANCDMGEHSIRFALYPHTGAFLSSDVVQTAYQFNVPALIRSSSKIQRTPTMPLPKSEEFFTLDTPNVVLDTVKIAEDPRPKSGGRDVVIRLYEAYGGRSEVTLSTKFKIKEAHFCNILEDIGEELPHDGKGR